MGSVVVNRSDCEFVKKIPENLVRIVLDLEQNDSALGTRIIKWDTVKKHLALVCLEYLLISSIHP